MIFRLEQFLKVEQEFDGKCEEDWVRSCDGRRVKVDSYGNYWVQGRDGHLYEMMPEWVEDSEYSI